MSTALISLAGVGKDYPIVSSSARRFRTLLSLLTRRGVAEHVTALDQVDLEVRRGESVGIVGENGAGKSTLLKVIAGVVKPTRGNLRVEGRVGALLELGTGFHPEYSGRDNIALSAALSGLSRAEVEDRLDYIIGFADIGDYIDQPVKHYSSGMVVRLGFAIATALEPDVLITDEVLAVGDESFQKKCIRWLEGFMGKGGTLLLCSHSMYHIQTLCQRAIWIHKGCARLQGNSFDVAREYLTYHEEKGRVVREVPPPSSGTTPRIESIWLERVDGARAATFAHGDDIVLQGLVKEPDDRETVLLFGIARADGTAIYGSPSDDSAFHPVRIEPRRFSFAVHFPGIALLPGKYVMRAHVLDAEGIRLFDTLVTEFVITGQMRDFGFVKLTHEWLPGRGLAPNPGENHAQGGEREGAH